MSNDNLLNQIINDAISYPFRGSGKYMLIIGALFSIILKIFSIAPLAGILVSIFSSGFFASYLFEIINTTATGKNNPCDWPDIREFWRDIFTPWTFMVASLVFSFGPFFLSAYFMFPLALTLILLILGFINFPMSLLCVAIYQNALSASWMVTIPAIKGCMPQYFILVVTLGIIAAVYILLGNILLDIPILGWLIIFFLWMYIIMLTGRILGLFYRDNASFLSTYFKK